MSWLIALGYFLWDDDAPTTKKGATSRRVDLHMLRFGRSESM